MWFLHYFDKSTEFRLFLVPEIYTRLVRSHFVVRSGIILQDQFSGSQVEPLRRCKRHGLIRIRADHQQFLLLVLPGVGIKSGGKLAIFLILLLVVFSKS